MSQELFLLKDRLWIESSRSIAQQLIQDAMRQLPLFIGLLDRRCKLLFLSTRPTNKGLEFMRRTLGWGRWAFRIWP